MLPDDFSYIYVINLSQDGGYRLSQILLIFISKPPHLPDNDSFFDRGEDGFYEGRLDKACRFPLIHGRFAEGWGMV